MDLYFFSSVKSDFFFVSFKPETNHPLDRWNRKPVTAVTEACKWTTTDGRSQTVGSGIWDQTPIGTVRCPTLLTL